MLDNLFFSKLDTQDDKNLFNVATYCYDDNTATTHQRQPETHKKLNAEPVNHIKNIYERVFKTLYVGLYVCLDVKKKKYPTEHY